MHSPRVKRIPLANSCWLVGRPTPAYVALQDAPQGPQGQFRARLRQSTVTYNLQEADRVPRPPSPSSRHPSHHCDRRIGRLSPPSCRLRPPPPPPPPSRAPPPPHPHPTTRGHLPPTSPTRSPRRQRGTESRWHPATPSPPPNPIMATTTSATLPHHRDDHNPQRARPHGHDHCFPCSPPDPVPLPVASPFTTDVIDKIFNYSGLHA